MSKKLNLKESDNGGGWGPEPEQTVAADSLRPDPNRNGGTNNSFDPTRSQMLAQVLAIAGGLQTDDLNGFLQSMASIGHEADAEEHTGDENRATLTPYPSAAIGTGTNPGNYTGGGVEAVREDLQKLFGEEHTPDFIDNATKIFESAVEAKLIVKAASIKEDFDAKVASLEEEFNNNLTEAYDEMSAQMVEKVDTFLNYVVEQWVEDNKLAIESGIRTEIAESFMSGLRDMFTEHYVDIPESKVDVVEALTSEVDALKARVDELISENVDLNESVATAARDVLIAEGSEGLTALEATKLRTLAEEVKFEDASSFKQKVKLIRESAFNAKTVKKPQTTVITEEIERTQEQAENELEEENMPTDSAMSAYVRTVTRTVKKL